MSRAVMVVGVARPLGARLAARLAADPAVDRLVGVDAEAPSEDMGAAEFAAADIRTSAIGTLVDRWQPDTVVHMNLLASRAHSGGRAAQKEVNVIGAMQLLGACQRSRSVRRIVLRSSTAVYGAGPDTPALMTEEATPAGALYGHEKDAGEVETYVRGFARRRPDVDVTILRMADVLGPTAQTVLARYFTLPVVPAPAGRDPRFQLLHEDDFVEALRLAAVEDRPGVFNVAGDGFLVLSQALRRAGRPLLPLPMLGSPVVGGVVRRLGLADLDAALVRFLTYGRGVDTTRMRAELRFEPAHTTAATFDAFVEAHAANGLLDRDRVEAAERAARRVLGDVRSALSDAKNRRTP